MMEESPSQQHPKPWVSKSYLIGIFFIVSVSVIWAASSVLIQHIYTDTHNTFHSPFLVTYIGISLFTLWLPTQRIVKCIQQCCSCTNTRHPYNTNEYGLKMAVTTPVDGIMQQHQQHRHHHHSRRMKSRMIQIQSSVIIIVVVTMMNCI
jgi:hypothetical protein